jgi:hypothetical protein
MKDEFVEEAGKADESESQERNRRLYGRTLSWILATGRPPGMIGEARSFEGRSAGAQASLS